MGQLLIGARHLHLPMLSAAPFFHGFLVIDYGNHEQRVFSADKGKGLLYVAPLLLYEDIFDAEHPDRRGLVILRLVSDYVDAGRLEASFRRSRARIEALDLTYTPTRNNCNSVITTLVLQAGIDVPSAPARSMPWLWSADRLRKDSPMQAEAASVFSPVPQSSKALLAAPIPWTDRQLGAENLKTLLLARLPAEPTGQDLLALFERLGVRAVRQGDMIQGRVSARGRFSLTPAFWSMTALVDPETDRISSLSVQYRSNI